MSERNWIATPNGGLRCVLHDRTFSRIRTCSDCDAARVTEAPITVEGPDAPVVAPAGCRSAEALEQTLNTIIDSALAQRDKALKGKSRPTQTIATKWTEVALKALRAAGEYARAREDWTRLARLEQRRRALLSRGAN
jgi:hypothetical protein